MIKIQNLSFIIQCIILFVYADTTLKPMEGQSMRSLLRGSSSQSQQYLISRSDLEDSAFIGYFKFSSLSTTTFQSIMKLEISQESYTFIHLFINSLKQPTLKVIFDKENMVEQLEQTNLTLTVNMWYILGIGYKYSIPKTYIIYGNPLDNSIQFNSFTNKNKIDTRINQIEFCVACKPLEYIYNQFQGQYSTIKIITKFEDANPNSRFYLNENGMANLLRKSFQASSDLQTFIKNQYQSTTFACENSDKVYFDGICIDKQQCSSVQNQIKSQFGLLNSIFFNSSNGQCDFCQDNCKLCNYNLLCLECDFGYVLDNIQNICKKCDSGSFYIEQIKACSQTCPSGFQQDIINQICVLQFQIDSHQLQNLLNKRIFNQNDGFQMFESTTQNTLQNQFSTCQLDLNTYGDFTFLGSYSALKTFQLRKTIEGFPKSPKKTISFIGFVYNNGNQNDFVLSINNKVIQMISYDSIATTSKNCDKGLNVNIYKLTYEVKDPSNIYNIIISSKVNGWGIRSFSMDITKCHPTCQDCINDSNPWSCTSCEQQSDVFQIDNQCFCNKGQYVNFKNCYEPPCYSCQACPSFCNSCEDLTGKCTSCSKGYLIQNGSCVEENYCTGEYTFDTNSNNYCFKIQDKGISHFDNNKISQYIDFWNFQRKGPFEPYQCFGEWFSPKMSVSSSSSQILNTQLQNFRPNHQSIQIMVNYTYLGLPTNMIYWQIDDQQIKDFELPLTQNTCSIIRFLRTQKFLIYKNNDDININFEIQTLFPFISIDLIIKNFSIIYSNFYFLKLIQYKKLSYFYHNIFQINIFVFIDRCHASCNKYSAKDKKCITCIPNASLLSLQSEYCSCNTGYYFTYDWQNSIGACQKCNSVCKTCNGSQATDCGECQVGYIKTENVCVKCESNQFYDKIQKKCIQCTKGCKSCDGPSSCLTCYPSMKLDQNICKCQDKEDQRVNIEGCSYNNLAFIDILLSNTLPEIEVNFGKVLEDLPIFLAGENSNAVCQDIFDLKNLKLIGINSKCKINKNIIKIELDYSAEIMEGDILEFKANKLKFKNDSVMYIDKFLNNIAIQVKPNNPIVQFEYNKIQNDCKDYQIILNQLLNDSRRGFKTISWKLMNSVSNQEDQQIEQILQDASTNKKQNISIPKGIISLSQQKQIQVQYQLKNSYTNSQVFVFEIRQFKNINIKLQSNLNTPSYIFEDFIVSLDYNIDYCDQSGKQNLFNEPVDITIEFPQQPQLNILKQNYSKNNLSFNINKYTFSPETLIEIKAKITISKEQSIYSEKILLFKHSKSNLISKIVGGNQKVDHKKTLTLKPYLRDLDIEDPTVDQQIIINWSCNDPQDDTKECVTAKGDKLDLNKNLNIQGGSFHPYNAIQITLQGKKDVRDNTHQIILLFLEYDLPILETDILMIDSFQRTVNLNEEIYVSINYQSNVNIDILSFSSTIVYENNVVNAIKFDYTKLRFQLWNYYSKFNRSNQSVQIRFSVFNPYYFMPSTQIIDLKINFPPEKCIFSIEPNKNSELFSLKTKITLNMNNCDDEDKPIKYQFFMYKSLADLEFEVKNPQLIKRRQLNNLSFNTNFETILPAGDIILMAVASDSLQAVFNSTLSIKINDSKYNENQYIQMIDDSLSISDYNTDEKISQLSLIAEDISQRKDLQQSFNINQKKIQIIKALKNTYQYLSSLSTFSTLSDKAISSLLRSGIIYNQNEQKQELENLKTLLSGNWSNPYENLTDVEKIIRQQQIYDYFLIADSLISNKVQENVDQYNLQIDIANKIGEKMTYNYLPNEDQLLFKGETLQILSQQVTQKNLCKYLFCMDQNDDQNNTQNPKTNQPKVYNVVYKTYENNPYKYDSSFQNFTKVLFENLGSKIPTRYPMISPDINLIPDYHLRLLNEIKYSYQSQDSNDKQNDSNSVSINFRMQSKENDNLNCLTRKNGQWTQKGCKLISNEKNQINSCICQEKNPTTIVDDLEEMIKNKNLQTAFGEQGLNNISNFTNFYKYIVFWLLLSLTISFIILYIKGKQLDKQQDQTFIVFNKKNNKIFPISDADQNNQLVSKNSYPITSQTLPFESKHKISIEQKSKHPHYDQTQSTKVIQYPKINISKISQTNEKQSGIVIDLSPLRQQDVQETKTTQKYYTYSQKELKSERRVSIQDHMNDIEGVVSCTDFKEESKKMKNQTPKNSKIQSLSNIPELSDEEYQDKLNKFMEFNAFKQMFYFHGFFGIFLVYNNELPRSLRFSCFYVRLVHSLTVSIVFDQKYKITQMVALSLVNALLLLLFIIILEQIRKKLGRFVLVFTLLCLLAFYYYVILTIISGQEPYISNLSMISFLMLTAIDLLFVAFIFAALQRYLALKTLKKQKLQTCSQKIFDFLQIQLIIKSIL